MADNDSQPDQSTPAAERTPPPVTEAAPPPAAEAPKPDPAPDAEGAAPAEAFAAAGGDGAAIDPGQERELWSGRTSWKHFYGKWALWAVAVVVVLIAAFWMRGKGGFGKSATFYWVLPLLILLSAVVLWAKFAIQIFGVRYRLTSQRLFIERGILSRTTDQTELVRVDDVRVRQGIVDRLVNSGDVEILSTDVSDKGLVLVGVETPDKIAEHVRQHMRMLRKKSLFVENL